MRSPGGGKSELTESISLKHRSQNQNFLPVCLRWLGSCSKTAEKFAAPAAITLDDFWGKLVFTLIENQIFIIHYNDRWVVFISVMSSRHRWLLSRTPTLAILPSRVRGSRDRANKPNQMLMTLPHSMNNRWIPILPSFWKSLLGDSCDSCDSCEWFVCSKCSIQYWPVLWRTRGPENAVQMEPDFSFEFDSSRGTLYRRCVCLAVVRVRSFEATAIVNSLQTPIFQHHIDNGECSHQSHAKNRAFVVTQRFSDFASPASDWLEGDAVRRQRVNDSSLPLHSQSIVSRPPVRPHFSLSVMSRDLISLHRLLTSVKSIHSVWLKNERRCIVNEFLLDPYPMWTCS